MGYNQGNKNPGYKEIKLSKLKLKKLYLKENKSILQICKKLKLGYGVIRNRLISYNIPFKTQKRASKYYGLLTKENLFKEYVKNKKTLRQLAKKHNCCSRTIVNYLNEYKISLRTNSQAKILQLKDPKNHPCYIEGLDRNYPLEFSEELKDKIRQRDNCQCQNCDMIEEEHIIVYGRVLDVHHIDYNKKNLKFDNLISLCQSCHMRTNFNRKYWQEYYKEKIYEL